MKASRRGGQREPQRTYLEGLAFTSTNGTGLVSVSYPLSLNGMKPVRIPLLIRSQMVRVLL